MKTLNCTFTEFERLWEENWLKKRDITPRVREDYLCIMRTHVIPSFDGKSLKQISPFDIDGLVNDMVCKAYSPKTIKNVFSVLNCTFEYAYRKGFVEENPCSRADDLPAIRKSRDIRCFSLEETKSFLQALEDEPLTYKAFFTLAVFGGFRRGELCALTWEDVDFENSCIHIRHAMSRYGGEEHIKEPKTASGIRTVVLPKCCFDILREIRNSARKGEPVKGKQAFVFTKARSAEPLSLQQPTSEFRKLLAHNPELPPVRLHDLRHTSASLLLASGIDIETISHRLGHSKPSVTLDIYGHALPEIDRAAADKLARLLEFNNKNIVKAEDPAFTEKT